mgnify:CR=1 FL=1
MYLAVRHPEFFPVEINTAPKAALLRIPGIGPKSALRILSARRQQHLGMAELKRMGVVLKRAQYFITCNGRAAAHGTRQEIAAALLDPKAFAVVRSSFRWMTLPRGSAGCSARCAETGRGGVPPPGSL